MRWRSALSLCAGVAVCLCLVVRGLGSPRDEVACEVETVARTSDLITFKIRVLAGVEWEAEPSCECVKIDTVGRTEVQGRVECHEVARYVTPGVLITTRSGHREWIPIPCHEGD